MNSKLITVEFNNYSKTYVFATFIDVKIGDTVVVDTCNGFQIATVTSLDGESPEGKTLKEVVDIVDVSAFKARKEKAKKLQKLKSKMDKRVKELQDVALYELLAKEDPELEKMLTELKNLM